MHLDLGNYCQPEQTISYILLRFWGLLLTSPRYEACCRPSSLCFHARPFSLVLFATLPRIISTSPRIISTSPRIISTSLHLITTSSHIISTLHPYGAKRGLGSPRLDACHHASSPRFRASSPRCQASSPRRHTSSTRRHASAPCRHASSPRRHTSSTRRHALSPRSRTSSHAATQFIGCYKRTN